MTDSFNSRALCDRVSVSLLKDSPANGAPTAFPEEGVGAGARRLRKAGCLVWHHMPINLAVCAHVSAGAGAAGGGGKGGFPSRSNYSNANSLPGTAWFLKTDLFQTNPHSYMEGPQFSQDREEFLLSIWQYPPLTSDH